MFKTQVSNDESSVYSFAFWAKRASGWFPPISCEFLFFWRDTHKQIGTSSTQSGLVRENPASGADKIGRFDAVDDFYVIGKEERGSLGDAS